MRPRACRSRASLWFFFNYFQLKSNISKGGEIARLLEFPLFVSALIVGSSSFTSKIEGGKKTKKNKKKRAHHFEKRWFSGLGLLMTRSSLQSASITVACSTIYTVSNSRNSMFSPSTLAFSAYKSQEEDARCSQQLLLHRSRYLCR